MYKCKICKKESLIKEIAEACEKSHDCVHGPFTYVSEAISSLTSAETDLGYLSLNKICTKCWTVVGEVTVPVSDIPTKVLQDMYDLYMPKGTSFVTVPHVKTH